MSYCPFYMITVDHFMDSILMVAQQQASGEVRQIGTYAHAVCMDMVNCNW